MSKTSARSSRRSLSASLRGLGDRNVSVIERRTDNQVSAQIAKARDRSKDRSVEPGINLAEDIDWANDVRPERTRHAVHRAVGVTTLSGLPLWDCTIAASCHPATHGFCERQFVQCADDKTVTRIEVRKATTSDQVIAVLDHDSLSAEGVVIE